MATLDFEKLERLAKYVRGRWKDIYTAEQVNEGKETWDIKVYSDAELARRMHMSNATLSRYLKRSGMPDSDNLALMHAYLGTDESGTNVYTCMGLTEPIPNDRAAKKLMRRIWPNLSTADKDTLIELAENMQEQRETGKQPVAVREQAG